MCILNKKFYSQDAAFIAKQLLGKIIVRNIGNQVLTGKIVETEAYYSTNDPASRAYKGYNNFAKLMWDEPGTIFIYMVHANWLLNIVTMPMNIASAVLIRAIEPLTGITVMEKHRKNRGINLTNGPGKLTQALMITKDFNNTKITDKDGKLFILDNTEKTGIQSSYRVGVKKDLKRKLRFFIRDNYFVSKARFLT